MRSVTHRLSTLYADGGLPAVLSGVVRFLRYEYPKPEVMTRDVLNGLRYDAAAPDPFETQWVDPGSIETYTDRFGTYHHLGAVRGGDWDRCAKPIVEHPKYEAVEARFVEGQPWEQTGIFEHMRAEIEADGERDGCRTLDDVEARYARIDRLYESIRESGYLPHEAVSDGDDFESRVDYVIVNVGRNGELIFNGTGWHRLSIAKVLGLEAIPVLVAVRHERWQSLRESVATDRRPAASTDDRVDIAVDGGSRSQLRERDRRDRAGPSARRRASLETEVDGQQLATHPDLRDL